MSREVKWRIAFEALSGKPYTLDILVDGYSGPVIPLRGGADPFETREDNSEEYFRPIRTQSGYLRVVDDGYDLNGDPWDWHELLPQNNMEHQVRLLSSGVVEWIGYMKAEMFTTRAFDYGRELEFPVICPLSLLGLQRATVQGQSGMAQVLGRGTLRTVGQVLHMALSSTGVAWSSVHVSGNVSGHADLNTRLNLMNYLGDEPDVNVTDEIATWTIDSGYEAMVSDIARFWGWTLYSRGLDVFIVSSGQGGRFRRLPFASLPTVVASSETYDGESTALEALDYMSTAHDEDYLPGRRRVRIESSSGDWGSVLQPDLSKLNYEWYGGMNHVIEYGHNPVRYYGIQFDLKLPDNIIYPYQEKLDNYLLTFNRINIGARSNTLLVRDDSWPAGEEKLTFSLQTNIMLLTGGTEPPEILAQRFFSICTLFDVSAPEDSMLSLEARARMTLNPGDTENWNPNSDYFRMHLRIGTRYLQPNGTWSAAPAAIQVYIGSDGRIKTTRSLFDPHPGASGFCVTMPEDLYGKLELGFLMAPSRDILLDGVTLKVVPKDDPVFPEVSDGDVWEEVANLTFDEEEKVSLSFASGDKNKYGRGQLFTFSGGYLTEVPFVRPDGTSGRLRPEQELLRRMVEAYGVIRHRLTVEVADGAGLSLPSHRYYFGASPSRLYSIQSVSHSWVDGTMRLTIVEL